MSNCHKPSECKPFSKTVSIMIPMSYTYQAWDFQDILLAHVTMLIFLFPWFLCILNFWHFQHSLTCFGILRYFIDAFCLPKFARYFLLHTREIYNNYLWQFVSTKWGHNSFAVMTINFVWFCAKIRWIAMVFQSE